VYHGAPARRWLALYAERFPTVEINSTFYRLPRRSAVAGWVAEAPEGFVFAVKVSRYLTHIRRLRDVRDGCGRLLERLEPMIDADELGPLLWQLPATFTRDDQRLGHALEALPGGLRHAFEFRHPSWFCEPVLRMLRDAGAALVVGDHPQRPFQTWRRAAPWTYVRLHYGHRGRRGNYSDAELRDLATRISRLAARADGFVYFNNDWEAFAVHNARRLARAL
jgi:uncharacterized protein YecE (DUF72 family)